MRFLAATALLATALPALAYEPLECPTDRAPEVPGRDRPTKADRQRLTGCDPYALYDGIGGPPNYVDARKCAAIQLDADDLDESSWPAGVLMMVYANGQGVRRDLDLALAFACGNALAPAERDARVQHLLAIRAGQERRRFDFCDDVTSGYMEGWCAARFANVAQQKRAVRLEAVRAKVPAEALPALDALLDAARAFFEKRADGEVDMSGTARNAYWIGERERLEERLLSGLEQAVNGKLPPAAGAAELERADRRLNASYRRIMAAGDDPDRARGTVTVKSIRAAERAWIPYRDAWAVFGTALHPETTPERWTTWITRERLAQLEKER